MCTPELVLCLSAAAGSGGAAAVAVAGGTMAGDPLTAGGGSTAGGMTGMQGIAGRLGRRMATGVEASPVLSCVACTCLLAAAGLVLLLCADDALPTMRPCLPLPACL